MNILIVTLGSRGDVQPFLALGCGLQAVGHNVTVATSSSFESFITELGLKYGYMDNGLIDLMETSEGRDAMENTNSVIGWIKTTKNLASEGMRINKLHMKEAWAVAQQAQPDIIIYHPKATAGTHIAEKLGIPPMMVGLQPILIPTTELPPIGIPPWELGGWYNKLSYKMIHMGYASLRGMINTFRKETLGLGKFPNASGVLKTATGDMIPLMHAFSKYVLPRPNDWPDSATVTGYWFLDQNSQDWQPPADLQAFLDAGEPPVYVGFGSMAGRDPQRLTGVIVDALKLAKVRGIIATGWGGLSAEDLPDTIFKIDQAPHDWLFQRVAAVVHHGGAGTTAAGLRAGKPTVICSFFGDQPFWGEQVHRLGVGPKHIPQKKVTGERLAEAITEVTTNTSMRQKAEALGEKIRGEDGIGNAIAIIEQVMNR
ncbi:MAG: glycosyltransferase family 1 protein [Anaerolineae bacterium]|nr:glycosyltransferase family 1 protein [Anaerolineae bacterium]